MKASGRRKFLLELQNWRCCWCGKVLTEEAATIEHIVPASLGGQNTLENHAVSHELCNKARGSNFLQPVHSSFLFDRVRERLKRYHEGIAKQDISKLGLSIPAICWSGQSRGPR